MRGEADSKPRIAVTTTAAAKERDAIHSLSDFDNLKTVRQRKGDE